MKVLRTIALLIAATLASAGTTSAALSFAAVTLTTPFPGSLSFVSGDFTGDGRPDVIAVHENDTFSFFRNAGDGTFLSPVYNDLSTLSTSKPRAVVAADFNQDTWLDLAIGHYEDVLGEPSAITVHLGDGTGAFAGSVLATPPAPFLLAVADYDNDGHADLATAGSGLLVYRGIGDGAFGDVVEIPIEGGLFQIVAAGQNNDGNADRFVVLAGRSTVVTVKAGSAHVAHLRSSTDHIALADLNGDAHLDLVTGSTYNNMGTFYGEVNIYRGYGYDYVHRQHIGAYAGGGVALGDFDTDGRLDLATGSNFSGRISFFRGKGDGEFEPGVTHFAYAGWPRLVVDDFNADGRPDLAGADDWDQWLGSVIVLINTTPHGCVDRLSLAYSLDTLTIGFTLRNRNPSIWSAWAFYWGGIVPLWSGPIPAVPSEVSFEVPLPGVSPLGNLGIITTMTTADGGLTCWDAKVVDTGGGGAAPLTMSDRSP
jgi:hypothetical protein